MSRIPAGFTPPFPRQLRNRGGCPILLRSKRVGPTGRGQHGPEPTTIQSHIVGRESLAQHAAQRSAGYAGYKNPESRQGRHSSASRRSGSPTSADFALVGVIFSPSVLNANPNSLCLRASVVCVFRRETNGRRFGARCRNTRFYWKLDTRNLKLSPGY